MPRTKPIKKQKVGKTKSLEDQFNDYFTFIGPFSLGNDESLEQKSPSEVVQSFTTYGAHENPV